MTSIPDHYAALGIDPTADPEVITAAYRALAKKFHPDTGAAAGTASPIRFDEIQKAYEVLRTPESRHAYDLELLAATERELQAHLAAKRRVAVREEQPGTSAPLPDLGDNIKCGNSLIGPDFYQQQQMTLLDDEDRYRINVFDWHAEFPQVFSRTVAGGELHEAEPALPDYTQPGVPLHGSFSYKEKKSKKEKK